MSRVHSGADKNTGSFGQRGKFHLGQIVATPGALELLQTSGHNAREFLARHLNGDWGDLCKEDRTANDDAVKNDGRLLSSYVLESGEKLWIITEWDRSVTTLLLPEDY